MPDAERTLDVLLASVEARQRELRAAQEEVGARMLELDSLEARLVSQSESQSAREAELTRREKEAERTGRQMAKSHLLEARRLVEDALGAARVAADDAAAREARRLVEEGIREQGERLAEAERVGSAPDGGRPAAGDVAAGDQVRLETGQSAHGAGAPGRRADGRRRRCDADGGGARFRDAAGAQSAGRSCGGTHSGRFADRFLSRGGFARHDRR